MGFSWQCPYCNKHTTIAPENKSYSHQAIGTRGTKYGEQIALVHTAICCPNPDCLELTIGVSIQKCEKLYQRNYSTVFTEEVFSTQLLPHSIAKPQPDYIPVPIREDYYEACKILNDSPKASATMSRRCLQGIVRDYWELPKKQMGNLASELNLIQEEVDPDTWEAIQAIRKIGNIGAHMEKDVNQIVDIDPDEARLLLELIESLFEDWYVAREQKRQRANRVKRLVEEKQNRKLTASHENPPE